MHFCIDELNFMFQMYQVVSHHLSFVISRIFS